MESLLPPPVLRRVRILWLHKGRKSKVEADAESREDRTGDLQLSFYMIMIPGASGM